MAVQEQGGGGVLERTMISRLGELGSGPASWWGSPQLAVPRKPLSRPQRATGEDSYQGREIAQAVTADTGPKAMGLWRFDLGCEERSAKPVL